MIEYEALKPCPFCGGRAKISVRDDEGNERDEIYEQEPYSGVSYTITHYVDDNEDCPIAV